jgi:anhydro-N-acetylmuramic acid kinase
MFVVGLMSGTSADGIDAALVEWPQSDATRPFRLVAYREDPFPTALQRRVHRLAAGRCEGSEALREYAALDALLAERFAESALRVVADAGLQADQIAAIGSHGQTVGHFPEVGGTLQIASPSRIAEHSGIETVGNFRVRDIAAGGEGAPLAPFFHWAVCGDPSEARVVLNLGGMANLTWLPEAGDPEAVIAFDIGPANSLIDAVVGAATDGVEPFDRDGRRAKRGRVDADLLETLLDDEFLRRLPPKSTGPPARFETFSQRRPPASWWAVEERETPRYSIRSRGGPASRSPRSRRPACPPTRPKPWRFH